MDKEITLAVMILFIVTCSTPTVKKCQAALRTLPGFPFFLPTCLCQDQLCNDFRELIFDHPFNKVKSRESDLNLVDALPTCNNALEVCKKEPNCVRLYESYRNACHVENGECRMESRLPCQSTWSHFRLSSIFGCLCPSSRQSKTCDKIFKSVNGNPCIDAQFLVISSTGKLKQRHSSFRLWQLLYNQTVQSNDSNSVKYSVLSEVYFQTSHGKIVGSSNTSIENHGNERSQNHVQYPPTPILPISPDNHLTAMRTKHYSALPPKFCILERHDQPTKYIREGYRKRFYNHDNPECSELCECNVGEILSCKVLECIKEVACTTGVAFYSHASPFYQAYQGQCLCYSGSFICSKLSKDIELDLAPGVHLYLGYSKIDEGILKKVTGQGAIQAIGAIQALISYHNVNSNKSECRVRLQKHHYENMVLQAVVDEFEDSRDKGIIFEEMIAKEKEECFEALESISRRINANDAEMRSHVVLSMFKVATAEVDVLALKSSSSNQIIFLKIGSQSTLMVAIATAAVVKSAI